MTWPQRADFKWWLTVKSRRKITVQFADYVNPPSEKKMRGVLFVNNFTANLINFPFHDIIHPMGNISPDDRGHVSTMSSKSVWSVLGQYFLLKIRESSYFRVLVFAGKENSWSEKKSICLIEDLSIRPGGFTSNLRADISGSHFFPWLVFLPSHLWNWTFQSRISHFFFFILAFRKVKAWRGWFQVPGEKAQSKTWSVRYEWTKMSKGKIHLCTYESLFGCFHNAAFFVIINTYVIHK